MNDTKELIESLRSRASTQMYAGEAARAIEKLEADLAQAVGEMEDQGPYINKLRTENAALKAELAAMREQEPASWMGKFDIAVGAELARVSHVQYDSHEICTHFAGLVRNRIAEAITQAIAQPSQW